MANRNSGRYPKLTEESSTLLVPVCPNKVGGSVFRKTNEGFFVPFPHLKLLIVNQIFLMDLMRLFWVPLLLGVLASNALGSSPPKSKFRLLVVTSLAKDHRLMMAAAQPVLENLAAANGFAMDFTDDATLINSKNLKRYQAFLMLQLAPFDMTPSQQAALQQFVEAGNGWVGVHGAGLTGREFLGPQGIYWDWFEEFLGRVLYSPHPQYQTGTVVVEDRNHPVTRHLPAQFEVADEWYEFNHSPRGNVRVLATADESTYKPHIAMGDHPIVWTNEKYRRMVYIAIGHDPSCLKNKDYLTLLTNAILWAGEK